MKRFRHEVERGHFFIRHLPSRLIRMFIKRGIDLESLPRSCMGDKIDDRRTINERFPELKLIANKNHILLALIVTL